MWIFYFLGLVFGMGFIVVNVYTAELVTSVEPKIKVEL